MSARWVAGDWGSQWPGCPPIGRRRSCWPHGWRGSSYLDGVSKVDIAGQLGISRFRVSRLLDSAREAGMVRIEIGLPGGALDAGLSAELCSAFGLKYAFAFDFPDEDEPALRRRLSEAAGQALTDIITPVMSSAWPGRGP